MRFSRMMSCAALAAMLAAAAVPEPAAAQLGKLLKKAVKQKVVETVVDKTASAAGVQPDTASAAADAAGSGSRVPGASKGAPQPGPRFSEYLLEITPELLDRVEKGLAAEEGVRQEINKALGKVLPPDEREQCEMEVMKSAEAQKVYMGATDLANGDTSYAHIRKASEEMARRFDMLVEPKCGLSSQKAQKVRDANADRLAAAGPAASGLTMLQLSLLKERVLPLCAAIGSLVEAPGEARIPTEAQAIYWVYTRGEVEALRPRCGKLAGALKTAL